MNQENLVAPFSGASGMALLVMETTEDAVLDLHQYNGGGGGGAGEWCWHHQGQVMDQL